MHILKIATFAIALTARSTFAAVCPSGDLWESSRQLHSVLRAAAFSEPREDFLVAANLVSKWPSAYGDGTLYRLDFRAKETGELRSAIYKIKFINGGEKECDSVSAQKVSKD